MLRSGLSALSDRVDSKFLTAYWLPAFVAVFGGLGILAAVVGPERLGAWIGDLGSVEQGIAAVIVLLQITMLGFVLRAFTQPIVAFFAGSAMPRIVAEWSMRGQRRTKLAAARVLGVDLARTDGASLEWNAAKRLRELFPEADEDLQPTLFGNVLARSAEHPRIAYLMDSALWWPRLSPLLPSSFQEMLGGTQAPLMALLNLSVVFAALGLGGFAVVGVVGGRWPIAIVFLIGGAVAARLCYRAAVSQAVAFSILLEVAFDLFRHEILRQMDVSVPDDLPDERELWRQMTRRLLDPPAPAAEPGEGTGADAPASATNPSDPMDQ